MTVEESVTYVVTEVERTIAAERAKISKMPKASIDLILSGSEDHKPLLQSYAKLRAIVEKDFEDKIQAIKTSTEEEIKLAVKKFDDVVQTLRQEKDDLGRLVSNLKDGVSFLQQHVNSGFLIFKKSKLSTICRNLLKLN